MSREFEKSFFFLFENIFFEIFERKQTSIRKQNSKKKEYLIEFKRKNKIRNNERIVNFKRKH